MAQGSVSVRPCDCIPALTRAGRTERFSARLLPLGDLMIWLGNYFKRDLRAAGLEILGAPNWLGRSSPALPAREEVHCSLCTDAMRAYFVPAQLFEEQEDLGSKAFLAFCIPGFRPSRLLAAAI